MDQTEIYALETFFVGDRSKEHLKKCTAVQRAKAPRFYTGRTVSLAELAFRSDRDFCGHCLCEVRLAVALNMLDQYAEGNPDLLLEEYWAGELDSVAQDGAA